VQWPNGTSFINYIGPKTDDICLVSYPVNGGELKFKATCGSDGPCHYQTGANFTCLPYQQWPNSYSFRSATPSICQAYLPGYMDTLEVYQTNEYYLNGFWWQSYYFVNELEYQDQVLFSMNATAYDVWYGYSSFAAYEINGNLLINITLSGHECSLQYG